MDFENINNQYMIEKEVFKKILELEDDLKQCKKDLKNIDREIEDAEIDKKRALEDKDRTSLENAKSRIKELQEKRKEIKLKGKTLSGILNAGQDRLNQRLDEIGKDSELKSHINAAMEKKYNREIKRIKKEQGNLEILQQAIKEHPSIENNLKGMIRVNEEKEKLEEEMKRLDPEKPEDKKRIDQIRNVEIANLGQKKVKNKKLLETTLRKSKIDIPMEFIEQIVNNKSFLHYKKQEKNADGKTIYVDDINVSKTLNNIVKSNNKRIGICERTIQKIPGAIVYNDKEENEEEKEQKLNLGKKIKQIFTKKEKEEKEEKEEKSLAKVEKLSWWKNPIKKFKQWMKERNFEIEETPESSETTKSYKKFKDVYKYEIVKDFAEEYGRKLEEKVKEENKNEQASKEDNEKSR